MYFTLAGRELKPSRPAQAKVLKFAINTRREYEALFEDAHDEIAIGESSTAYLANPSCIDSIQGLLPTVKIVAILRHPVNRAFSNYRMYRRWGFEKRSFHRAISDEIMGLSNSLPQGQRYLELGMYSQSLKQFLEVFGRNRVRVYLFDDFLADPQGLLGNICEFLRVRPNYLFETHHKHNADFPGSLISRLVTTFSQKDKLTEKNAKMLNNYYSDELQSLQLLLNIDLGEWRERY
jgi:hypothetical protein